MFDATHWLLKFVDHERFKLLGGLVGVLIVISMVSCEVAIRSPFSGEKVTRQEFRLEAIAKEQDLDNARTQLEQALLAHNKKVELYNEQKAIAEEAFEEKERLQEGFLEIVGGAATTMASGGTVNVAQALMAALALGGVGTGIAGVVDSARKNKVITREKAKNNETTAG